MIIPGVGENLEQLEFSYFAGGNGKQLSPLGKSLTVS